MTERTVLESIPQKRVVSASLQCTVHQAACKMTRAHCGSVLVVDDSGSMRGIFTERDLMVRVVARSLAPETTFLSDVMTPNPCSVSAETSVRKAVFLMKQYGIRHLPIVAPDGNTIGVFSIRDALPREIGDADDLSEAIDDHLTNVLA